MFIEKPNQVAKVVVLPACMPTVYISHDAIAKMELFVANCPDEIGWLGTAYRNAKGDEVHITDVYLFDQEVHATTTEITPEGLTEFAEHLLARPDGVDIWNSMKVWGHSHVNMGVSPSGQDDAQMKTFESCGHEFFIRIIANKKGEMRVDFYDFHAGIKYDDIAWVKTVDEYETSVEEEIQRLYASVEDEVERLRASLDKYHDEYVDTFKESILAEMATKVRKKTWQATTWRQGYVWDQATRTWVPPVTRGTNIGTTQTVTTITSTSPVSEFVRKAYEILVAKFGIQARDKSLSEVLDYLLEDIDVIQFAACDQAYDVLEEIEQTYGYHLSYTDAVFIHEYCKNRIKNIECV